MTHSFNMIANDQPAMLERILRVVRHRGFALQSIHFEHQNEQQVAISLTVTGTRPVGILHTQLDKLYDITQLELTSASDAVAISA
jgi:acetolactate synthase II small subunit